jgi:predicted  nucleic acid-binding Zn-ribbon protein
MADTVEKKTYLVNVESNLDQYAKEAAVAADEVDRLTEENKKLKESGQDSGVEFEKNNAKLRVAKKEYADAKKNVATFTSALKSETGSRKQLGETLRLQQLAMGKLGGAYIKDEKGVRKLNPLYVEQTKRIKATKDAIVEYDQAQGDGRSNIGNYGSALEGLEDKLGGVSPAADGAIGGVKKLGASFKALLANPVVLVISAIVGVLALLFKAFKRSQENSIVLNKAMGALKGIFQTLLKVLQPVAEFIVDNLISAFQFLGKVVEKVVGFVTKALDFLGFEKAADAVENWTNKLKEGAQAGADLAEAEVRLRNEQRKAERVALEFLKTSEKLRQLRDDEEASIEDRIKANEKLAKNLIAQAKAELDIAELALDVANKKLDMEGETDDNLDRQAEALTKIAEIEERITGFTSEQLVNAVALRKEEAEKAKEKADAAKAALDEQVEAQEEADEEEMKRLLEQFKQEEELYNWKEKRELENAKLKLELAELTGAGLFDIERQRLELQKQAEIKAAIDTGADINDIYAKYALLRGQIDEAESDAKLALQGDFAGNLAIIFGENTAIGKAAAVAQTTIATYTAAMEAYKSVVGVPIVGPALAVVAAGAAIATGLKSVKKILAVDSGLPGDSTGASTGLPTSIVTTPVAQRAFSNPVPSSFFTQQQLSQSELNAAQPGNLLTAADIAQAIAELPPPVVTVEDINAKAESKRKVEVRANI